ncbi:DUF58 domain-containing protein [Ramlibacter sp. MAHUQ-53]|uniref:DUF58 domain-containing protein n=1 Tax=unclassified Ramlibacter TaxID=2617605 RepID=UPI00363A1A6F
MRALATRLRAWWHSRLPRADTVALTHRNVYILPTRPGLMLAATLLVLLVASINYQLNLGYLVTFLLGGAALAAMHVSHANLRGLQLALSAPAPQFCGAAAPLTVTLTNTSRRARAGVALAVSQPGQPPQWAWCDVPARGSSQVQVTVPAGPRGLQPLPLLAAETRFPLGTFRAWALWRPAARMLVYPQPEALPPPLPPGEATRDDGRARRSAASGEFDGVRAWRRGDPMRLVAWKKAARTGELVSRDTQQSGRQVLWLDLAQAGAGDTERRLSRLTAWVLQADRLGLDYGLRLPGLALAPGQGEAHRLRCLEALALC